MSVQARIFADGRLHLQEGPIDLIIEAWGDAGAKSAAYQRAAARFSGLLAGLVAELPALRQPVGHRPAPVLKGPVARRMAAAVAPYQPLFITPMAAVAGAVAEEVLAALVGPGIDRAYVNNGGDIALFLGPGESLTSAIAARPGMGERLTVHADSPVRGIATSGWRGRSFSLGIADAVTVLAPTPAMADAAATVIANAVDLPGHPMIGRRPACAIKAESDLGQRRVTVAVGPLTDAERDSALSAGLVAARAAADRGLIVAAALFLQGEVRMMNAKLPGLVWAKAPVALSERPPMSEQILEDALARV
ncbi:MAG: UPF0280 family protein [Paracoccaceae bacterium]